MANMRSRGIGDGDEENVVDQKSGFDRGVAKQDAGTGNNLQRRPSEEGDIPQEPLATRFGKIRRVSSERRDSDYGSI
jgi:hypothetical protein